MQKYFILYILSVCLSFSPQVRGQNTLWTTFESLNDSLRQKPKPLLIFVKAKWCKYCKMQENATFKDKSVKNLLQKKFYCLKLDAEAQNTIRFLNRDYLPSKTGYHQLANYLARTRSEITLPTTLILDKNFSPLVRWTSFLEAKDLIEVISRM